MNTSRASSVNASPHLVASKHDAKCRRVPRIISRRFYVYRQPKPPFQQPRSPSAHPFPARSDRDFSPGALDLPCLEETILRFLVKYPKKRSCSTDSDPLVQFRSEMNKSAFFNHCLMKRRYSVPETVMRKHKLQESQSKRKGPPKTTSEKSQDDEHDTDALDTSSANVRDESCQTELCYEYGTNRIRLNNSCKRTSRSRKRENLRYFKKTNSYCQYKSLSMFHKKMCNKNRDTADGDQLQHDVPFDVERLRQVNTDRRDVPREKQLSAVPPGGCRNVKKSKSDKAISATQRLAPIARQHSYPPANSDHPSCGTNNLNDSLKKLASMRTVLIRPKIVLAGQERLSNVPRKTFLDFGKSIDQNTSGYNTVCGSLDDTPRRRTPETPAGCGRDQPTNGQPTAEEKKFGSFPITFHSESVFVHPYENGFLSHKELHHISIQLVPDTKLEEEPEAPKDYFKTEVNVGVRQQGARSQATSERMQTKIEAVAKTLSDISEKSLDKDERSEQSVPLVREPDTPRDSDDCTVPNGNLPLRANQEEGPRLKIEVDVPTLDLSKSCVIQEITPTEPTPPGIPHSQPDIIQEPPHDVTADPSPKAAAPREKCASKAALNYLFQKLGDSYPKRHLLKQPTFPDYSRQPSRYYSDLFKGDCLQVPHKVHFNNQTYDILSGNLLPNEWSSAISSTSYPPYYASDETLPHSSHHANKFISGDTHNEPLSDSDISIPDSLEDFQQQHQQQPKPKHNNNNKYHKYDQRLARGDVAYTNKPSSRPQNSGPKGVAYFLPLSEAPPPKNGMPAALRQKLRSRSKNLSRHILCVDTKRKSPKRGKLCHKQIQTSLNGDVAKHNPARLGLKKGTPKGEDQLPRGDESDLDEKIMDILLKGLKMQEMPTAPGPSGEHPVTRSACKNANSPMLSENQPVVSEYVEMYRFSTPGEDEAKEPHFHSEDSAASNDVFEVLQSEEEIGRINSTNYYKSVKKSRRIYYPTKSTTKHPEKSSSSNGCSTQSNATVPTFSKYQKKLREFRHQIRRQNFDKINPLSSGSSSSNDIATNCAEDSAPQQVRIKKMLRDKHKMKNFNCKIPGIRFNRFHQRFEAIPEEMGASSTEQVDQNLDTKTGPTQTANLMKLDENKNVEKGSDQKCDLSKVQNKVTNQQVDGQRFEVKDSNNLENANIGQPNGDQEAEYTDELKSQKGKNSLSTVREQEELITLSRGWINFYLLNGNQVEDNETTEQIEGDESVTMSETSRIPQQYSVHIHAKPQNLSDNSQKISSLPGLCKTSPGQSYKNGKLKATDKTVLPDISHSNRHKVINANLRNLRSKNALPKLHPSDESDTSRKAEMELAPAEPVTGRDICAKEMPVSGLVTSSVHSESSAEEISDRNRIKKLQRYHRPHTYHATRTSNQWSLTIEGNHGPGEKQESDIEMQLFVKNKNNGNPNQTWKFSIKNEEASQTQGYDRHARRNYLPHLNVNYKMLPFPIYHDDSASYSENNSRSNSAMSCRNVRGANKIKESSSRNLKRFNGDMRLQITQLEDDLTVTGSAITPERKPRVPTMSERDLYRMKLIRQSSMENKTS